MASAPEPAWAAARQKARVAEASAQARRLFQAGEFERALPLYAEAARLAPSHPPCHFNLAQAAWKCGQGDPAERHFLEAIRLDPDYARAHDALGQWYLS